MLLLLRRKKKKEEEEKKWKKEEGEGERESGQRIQAVRYFLRDLHQYVQVSLQTMSVIESCLLLPFEAWWRLMVIMVVVGQ